MARIEMIIATEQDDLKTRTIAIPCKIHIGNPNFSLADAVRSAYAEQKTIQPSDHLRR